MQFQFVCVCEASFKTYLSRSLVAALGISALADFVLRFCMNLRHHHRQYDVLVAVWCGVMCGVL